VDGKQEDSGIPKCQDEIRRFISSVTTTYLTGTAPDPDLSVYIGALGGNLFITSLGDLASSTVRDDQGGGAPKNTLKARWAAPFT
jgi:hypothetical protein